MNTHACSAYLCEQQVDREWCLCRSHWKLVPRTLRDEVGRAYNRYATEQSAGFRDAVNRMNAWIIADAEVNEQPRRSWDQTVAEVRARDAARAARRAESPPPKPRHLWSVP